MDITLQVDYGQDIGRVHDVLAQIAGANPWSLDEPEPVIIISDFKESGIEVQFGLWFAKTDFVNLKNSIMKDIVSQFDAEKIRFAHPNRLVRMVESGSTLSDSTSV